MSSHAPTETSTAATDTVGRPRPAGPWSVPPVDVYENADGFLLLADIPGVADDGLSLDLDRGELRVEARLARGEGGFRRRFTVPDGIDADAIKAELSAGVLRVTLPKAAAVKPRRIPVT